MKCDLPKLDVTEIPGSPENGKKPKSKLLWIVLASIAFVLVVGALSPAGNAVRDLLSTGVLDNTEGKKRYEGDTEDRLKAIFTAASQYHRSEQMFPQATSWMDDLRLRMKTADLQSGDEVKKLIRPDLETAEEFKNKTPKVSGFAMNAAIAGKYDEDLKNPTIVLFFESKETAWNQVGDPSKDGVSKGWAINLKGDLVRLP